MVVYGTVKTRTHMSLRGENEVTDAAIHCMQWVCTACAPHYWFTVDRHGLGPRDDKAWNGMVVYGSVKTRTHLSLRGENEVTDAAIHCMQWTFVRTECAVRLLAHSGSPRAFSPRDVKEKGKIKRCSSFKSMIKDRLYR